MAVRTGCSLPTVRVVIIQKQLAARKLSLPNLVNSGQVMSLPAQQPHRTSKEARSLQESSRIMEERCSSMRL